MDRTVKREVMECALVWAALAGLLALTVVSYYVEMGIGNVIANLGIAGAKGALIVYFFMHLKRSGSLVRLVAILGPLWLALLIGLSLADFFTRELPDWPW